MASTAQDSSQATEQERIKAAILDWAAPGFPLQIREEAAQVYHDFAHGRSNDEVDYYVHPLVFGTGGLRGVIGAGPGRMNRWTVGRTTLGLCHFLEENFKKPSLVIAYDCRRMSREFAATSAGIAASRGLQVYLFEEEAPTPILSYAIRRLKASGGVVITASHNPPEYNGYKVYLDDGSQLVGKPQKKLEEAIENAGGWDDIPFLASDDSKYKKRVHMVGADIRKSYYDEFKEVEWVSGAKAEKKKNLQVVYSPLHGTGGAWLPGLLRKYGFATETVPEQEKPDGEFPTVKSPNPEEIEALKMSEEKAKSIGADLFLASDPDADRMGAGIRQPDGSYVYLNGNQIGSIMCAHLCELMASEAGKKKRLHVFKTIVTTDLQKRIAEENGVRVKDVLTGFKYIAEQMRNIDEGKRGFDKNKDVYLFGGEESYGYLPVDFVRDKDSLASSLLLCEILAERGDLVGYLNQVYLKYGLYLEDLKSVTLKGSAGKQKMQEVIDNLRKEDLIGWKLGERNVSGVLDFESQTLDGKPSPERFADLPKSNVVQLLLEPEGKLTIRPSGTEPKVKLYASLRAPQQPSSLEELSRARSALEDELASISGHFIARTGLAG